MSFQTIYSLTIVHFFPPNGHIIMSQQSKYLMTFHTPYPPKAFDIVKHGTIFSKWFLTLLPSPPPGSHTLVKQFGHLMQSSPERVRLLLTTNWVMIRTKEVEGYINQYFENFRFFLDYSWTWSFSPSNNSRSAGWGRERRFKLNPVRWYSSCFLPCE